MFKFASFLLVMMLFLGACSPNPDKTELFSSEGTISVNDDNPSYRPEQGEEIYEDQNPNFLNIGERRTQNAIGESQGMLRTIVDEDEHFTAGMIYTNGRKAYVNVRPTAQFEKDELAQYEKQLKKKLMKAVPRYEVILKVRKEK